MRGAGRDREGSVTRIPADFLKSGYGPVDRLDRITSLPHLRTTPRPLPGGFAILEARMNVRRACFLLVLLGLLAPGCTSSRQSIDPGYALQARLGLRAAGATSPQDRDDGFWDRVDREYEGEVILRENDGKSVILGELLAFFPGILVHGIGHYYAGDRVTARKINQVGQWGYLLTAVGGGLVAGAYYLDDSSEHILPVSLYVVGGGVGAVGLTYFFTAWISDMWDVPRAIETGGEPWSFYEENALLFD